MSGQLEAQLDRLAALDGAPFTLAALAARRFPEGEALEAYVDGEAGLADYLRCGEPGCPWGRAKLADDYCRYHAAERTAASKRAYQARMRDGVKAARPSCCPSTRRCQQHADAGYIKRDYTRAWQTGARGARRVEWLYELFGQTGGGWGCSGLAWLDSSDDGHNDRLRDQQDPKRYVRPPYPDLGEHKAPGGWFTQHPGWINHPLPETAARPSRARPVSASVLRPQLDRLAEIHRIRHVNGYWPWGENVRTQVRGLYGG